MNVLENYGLQELLKNISIKNIFKVKDLPDELSNTEPIKYKFTSKEATLKCMQTFFEIEESKIIFKKIDDLISEPIINKDDIIDTINLALVNIEEQALTGESLVCHPNIYKLLRNKNDWFDPTTQREILNNGIYGHIYTLDVYVSAYAPKNTAYIIPKATKLYINESINGEEVFIKVALEDGEYIQKIINDNNM